MIDRPAPHRRIRLLAGAVLASGLLVACSTPAPSGLSSPSGSAEASAPAATTPVATAPGQSGEPSLAPPVSAAGRIVFVRFQPAVNHSSLFAVDPDGSHLTELMPGYPIGFSVPRWSRAGNLVGAISDPTKCPCEDQDPLGYGFETIVRSATGTHDHIHLDSTAISVRCSAWSADGALLACEGWSPAKAGKEGVYTVSSAGGAATRLTTAPSGIRDIPADYAADGSRLLFVRASYAVLGLGQLWMVNTDGSNAHKITDTLTTYRAGWSDDGRWIVGERDGIIELFDLQNMTADPARITIPGGKASEPRFSPDGSRIVFVYTKKGDERTSIRSIARDGSDMIVITSGSIDRSPDWASPGF